MTTAPAEPGAADVAQAFFGLAHQLKKRVNAALRAQGLSLARGRALHVLATNGPTRVVALGAELGLTPRTATESVDALERDGLVERRSDPTDRRAALVCLTAAGIRLHDELAAPRRAAIDELFGVLDGGQRGQLLSLLEILRTSAGTDHPGTDHPGDAA